MTYPPRISRRQAPQNNTVRFAGKMFKTTWFSHVTTSCWQNDLDAWSILKFWHACMLALPHYLTISSRLSIVWFCQFFVLGTFYFLFCFCLFFILFYFYFILYFFSFYYPLHISYLPCWTKYCKVRRSGRTAYMFPASVSCVHFCACMCVCARVFLLCTVTLSLLCVRAPSERV